MRVLMRGCGAAVALALSLVAGAPAAQPSWGERVADRDVALSDIGIASGAWSDGDTVWVSDWSGSAVRAYALRGGARRAGLDMAELPASIPAGLWSDGDTLWVSDFSDDALDARRLATGAAVAGRGFAAAGNDAPTGLWSDGSTLWAADYYDRKAYAYVLSDGTRASSRDLALAGTGRPFGLWSDGATLLAADWTGGRVLAYRLSDGSRLPDRDIDTSAAGNAKPMGLWSDGATLWVTDEQDDRLYAYAVPGLLEVRPPAAADASLASLSLTGMDIGTFAAGTLSYAAEVAHDVATTTVTAAATQGGATVAITPADADPETPGHQVSLARRKTVVEVVVTAANGATRRTYAVAVTRAGSPDATLGSLTLSGVDIGAFDAERLDYAARVPYPVGSTTVAATAAHGSATVAVTPVDADDGAPGHQVALAVGETVVEARVTAQDGTTVRTYAATVSRAAPSTDAALGALGLTGVDLGAFDPDGLSYAASVDYLTSLTTVTATARTATATVAVSPADADGEAPGHQVRLAVGETVVEVRVTAQDGTTVRTYAATVVRAAPDAALRSLRLSGVDIGTFDPDTASYTGLVGVEVTTTTVTATGRHAAATVQVSPADADADAAGHQVRLAVGRNVVEILVTAQDGVTARPYSATVWRGRHDAALRSLGLSGVDIGTFEADDLAYSGSVDYEASTTTVTAQARDAAATVAITPADADSEAAGHQVRLAVGGTVVEVRVTAHDGITARTYTATVTRATPEGYQASVSAWIGDDGRLRIDVPSATNRYHVLYYRPAPDGDAGGEAATEYAVAIHPGAEGAVVLDEPLRVSGNGSYRVETYSTSAPGDVDGDGVDDLTELGRAGTGGRAPLNAAGVIASEHGAVAVPDMATFEALSYYGRGTLDSYLADLEYIKYLVIDAGTDDATVYYMDTNRHRMHARFWQAIGRSVRGVVLRGDVSYHPYVVAPNGETGAFRHGYQPDDSWSFELVSHGQELLAASMPFLRNRLVYQPMSGALARYEREKAKYDASRVVVYLESDLFEGSVFGVLNAAVGYGLLRVLESGERPTFRDVAVLRHLPTELPAVAGVISLQRQTPLSHVNLRAVQDGVPNAYIGNALDDPLIAKLVGRYVRFELAEDPKQRFEWVDAAGETVARVGFKMTEATAEEVAAHHAARRPAEAQTPARDLTVTAYRALGSVAFADADAFGVKAANLATLRTLGLTDVEVPDGYALPLYYYDEFMKHNGFYADVDALLADADFQGGIAVRDRELRKLRRRIENAAVPEWMATSLGTLRGLFAEGTPIRCRSSTNNEDLPGFSGAGLYDSVTHRPEEGHLSKSIKQVYASLWNLRAFEEREFHRIDHRAAAMGVLLHPNFDAELANGVAVSDDPVYGSEDAYYVNVQVGENLVTNPSSAVVPEQLLLTAAEDGEDGEYEEAVVQRSSLVADDARVLEAVHVATLYAALGTIHDRFATLYEVGDDDEFSMEIEFKVTAADALAIKQARPWVY